MDAPSSQRAAGSVSLCPVNRDNWRAVAQLKVAAAQYQFVAEPAYYLAMCCYEDLWQPLAISIDGQVIGFMMWAIDPADGSCWLGGILVDQRYQGQGYGRQAIQAAIAMLTTQHGHQNFALSYQLANQVARHLYQSLGFLETDEWEGDEIVARMLVAQNPEIRQ